MDQQNTNIVTKTSAMAIVSLITGLLCIPIVPIVFGHLARGEIRKSNGSLQGAGIALAGLILGYLLVGLFVMGLAFGVIAVMFGG